ncbi:glycan biosynthesis hexose transferase WsfD [Leifsonia shinshuensis]
MWLAAILCGLGACGALLLHLFVPTVVGIGDQGDGQRLVCELGVANRAPFDYTKFTQYIYTSWVPHQWFGESCGAGGSGEPYYSSQSLLLWPAKWITPLFGWGQGLDTRAVGILCVLVFGILLALFVTQLPGQIGFRILIAAAVTAVMDDGVFADFFISPYSEPACFLGVFATLVALMFLWRREHVTWLGILLVTLACAVTITAKTQMISMLPVVAVALLWRPYRTSPPTPAVGPRSRGSMLRRGILLRVPALVAVVILVGATGAYAVSQPKRFSELNLYNAVFVEMLPHSPDPKADLAWLGLPANFASSSGTTVASPNAAIYDADYPEFLQKVSQEKIVLFYLAHPDRLVSMADRGLDAIAHPVLGYIGSYTAGSGHKPWAKEHRFPLIEGISVVFAAVPLLILVVQLVTLILGIAVASRRRLGPARTAFGAATVFFVIALWLQFWTVMLSEGESEIYKHMIVTTFMSSLCLVWIPALIMLLRNPAPAAQPTAAARIEGVADAV